MAAGKHIGFPVGNIGPPTKCTFVPSLIYKFGADRIYSFGYIAV